MVLCAPAPAVTSRSDRTSALLVRGVGFDRAQGSAPVRSLQRRLRAVGVDPGPVDGRFGALTEAAVRRFQSARGLVVDGIVGPRTRPALRAPVPLARGAGGDARSRVGSGTSAAAPAARGGRPSGPGRWALWRADRGRGATLPAGRRARGRWHRRPPHHTAAGAPRQAGSDGAAAADRTAGGAATHSAAARAATADPRNHPAASGYAHTAKPTRSGSRCWSQSQSSH